VHAVIKLYDEYYNLPLNIVVEEIYVQERLNKTAHIHDVIVLVVRFVVGPVHPIHYVQCTVRAKEEHVMACKRRRKDVLLKIVRRKSMCCNAGQQVEIKVVECTC
jgi:hypothetical protein